MVTELYINGIKADLEEGQNIVTNYSFTDLNNPSTQRDNYSYNVALKGTRTNNKIFEGVYRGDYKINKYSPSKKIPYKLFIDGIIKEDGYLQLTDVSRDNNELIYNCTLFGGLGDYFYNLSYKTNGEAMTVRDILDLQFTINRDFVKRCWNKTSWSGNDVTDWINFAPSYNGHNKDFDSKSVLINTDSNTGFPKVIDTDYKPYNGWAIGKLQNSMNPFEALDLRSYCQRPLIKTDKLIKAIAEHSNYKINYGEFFKESNPYWSKSWFVLPLLNSNLLGDKQNSYGTFTNTPSVTVDRKKRTGELYLGDVNLVDLGYNTRQTYTATIKVKLNPPTKYASINKLFTSSILYPEGDEIYVRFITKNSSNQVLDTSGWERFGDLEGSESYRQTLYFDKSNDYTLTYTKNGIIASGELTKYSGQVKVYAEFDYRHNRDDIYMFYKMPQFSDATGDAEFVSDGTVTASVVSSQYNIEYTKGIRSNAVVTEKELWKNDETPANILLGYCKLFGLIFLKDAVKKEISILTRKEFYNGKNIDLTGCIDYSKNVTVDPTVYDTRWFRMKFNDSSSYFLTKYKTEYKLEYGQKRINTGYEFNDTVTDMFDSPFDNIASGTMSSKYYRSFIYNGKTYSPWMIEGFQYNLFKISSDNKIDSRNQNFYLRPFDTVQWNTVSGADMWDKMCFESDDSLSEIGVGLCFFNGRKELKDLKGNWINISLTDDNDDMYYLNDGTPCYLYDEKGGDWRNTLPQFSRYLSSEGIVNYSWDFGLPKEFYCSLGYDESTTLYNQFWKEWMEDQYDDETKTIECFIDLRKYQKNKDLLRNFFYLDGSYWVINSMDSDLNDITKVHLIKVNVINNYKS